VKQYCDFPETAPEIRGNTFNRGKRLVGRRRRRLDFTIEKKSGSNLESAAIKIVSRKSIRQN